MSGHFHYIRLLSRNYGFRLKFLAFLFWRFLFHSGLWPFFLIEQIISPLYRTKTLDRPVFLIGHPRSGTTFLHRFIAENTSVKGLRLWQMMAPALVLQKCFRWLFRLFNKKSSQGLYDPAIHKTSFFSPETDDAAAFFRYFEGLFTWIYFQSWNFYNSENEIREKLLELTGKEKHARHLSVLYKILGGERVVSKSFSSALDIDKLIKLHPNSKIILLLRDPREAVVSSMSLVQSIQDKLFDFKSLPDEKKSFYYNNLYRSSIVYYRSIQSWTNNNPDRIHTIKYHNLKSDFSDTIRQLFQFCEIDLTTELQKSISDQANRQSGYKTKHKYMPEDFFLSEEQILSDFAFFYEANPDFLEKKKSN